VRGAPGIAVAVGLLACAWSFGAAADDDGFEPPDVATIDSAIDRGVAALRARQHEDGSWGPCVASGTYGSAMREESVCCGAGPTAFALFTLAKCGVEERAPEMRKGIRWLRAYSSVTWTSYESAAVILMLAAIHETDIATARERSRGQGPLRGTVSRPPPGLRFAREDWRWLRDRVDHLGSCQGEGGGFGYYGRGMNAPPLPQDAYADVACTHFALLALRDASHAGIPVEEVCGDVWSFAATWLLGMQQDDGGFGYRPGETWSAGMTADGTASLVLCREQIALLGHPAPPGIDEAIGRAQVRMGEQFDPERNAMGEGRASLPAGHYHYCYLYGVECVGDLTGRREFGGRDWYLRGASFLLREQREGGHWRDSTCLRPQDSLGTCFALLFLKRATIPVLATPRD